MARLCKLLILILTIASAPAPVVIPGAIMRTIAGAAGGATAADTFNRADATPISNPMSDGVSTWATGLGGNPDIGITSNQCKSSGGGEKFGRVSSPTFAANHWSQITIVATFINDVSAAVRMDSNGNCYAGYVFDSNNLKVYKVTANGATFTELANFVTTAAIVAGDVIRAQATGSSTTNIELFLNGVTQGNVNDSSTPHTTGQPGVHISGDDALDGFSASDL